MASKVSEIPIEGTPQPDAQVNFSDNDDDDDEFHEALSEEGEKFVAEAAEGMEKMTIKEEEVLNVVGMTEEQIEMSTQQAETYKAQGNVHYSKAEYSQALDCYTLSLQHTAAAHPGRAVYYANRAAVQLKLKAPKNAVDDCTKALAIDPNYVKVLLRRAQTYEEMDKLEQALEDYNKVLQIDPGCRLAEIAAKRLPPVIAEKNERMKQEMLGKLKDLGNTLLGKFGLSTDNFKMEQKPDGSYGVSFQQGP